MCCCLWFVHGDDWPHHPGFQARCRRCQRQASPEQLGYGGSPLMLIQLLPISLAGWGVREAVLVVALAPFGVPAEAALATSVLLGLCLIASSLPGGLIWLGNWDIAPSGVEKKLFEASHRVTYWN